MSHTETGSYSTQPALHNVLRRYHSQLDKKLSEQCYVDFIAELQGCATREGLLNSFRKGEHEGKYAKFDKRGVPAVLSHSHLFTLLTRLSRTFCTMCRNLTAPLLSTQASADGKALSKAEKKAVDAEHKRLTGCADQLSAQRRDRWRSAVASGTVGTGSAVPDPALGVEALYVVAGTFGNRQGFRLVSDSGPSTHVFKF
jgi:hypothetical protein